MDNTDWGSWTNYATDEKKPWKWSFDPPEGDGYYEFYTIAADEAKNVEKAPREPVAVDTVKPESHVHEMEDYWYTEGMLPVEANATDIIPSSGAEPSGLKNVELHYRYSPDNTTWSSWRLFGTDNGPSYGWSFNAPEGDGYYELYTISGDVARNVENKPVEPDERIGVDTTPPESEVGPVRPYWRDADHVPFKVSARATDNWRRNSTLIVGSGVKSVELQYRYSKDNENWGGWKHYEKDNSRSDGWSWMFDVQADGFDDGYYEFRTVATDIAQNVEQPPESADSRAGVDTVKPRSHVDKIERYWWTPDMLPYKITASSEDIIPPNDAVPSGSDNVALFYRSSYDNETWTDWKLFGVDHNRPYSFAFDAPDGYKFYEVYTIAEDVAGNVEDVPGEADERFSLVIPAELDLDPDTLNLNSRGKWVTGYVEFVPDLDPAKIRLGPGNPYNPPALAHTDSGLADIILDAQAGSGDLVYAENNSMYGFVRNAELTDGDDDGELERMVKFSRQEVVNHIETYENIGENRENVELTVVGRWGNGAVFADLDGENIHVMKRGKAPENVPGRSENVGPPENKPGKGGHGPPEDKPGKGKDKDKDKGKGKDKDKDKGKGKDKDKDKGKKKNKADEQEKKGKGKGKGER